MIPFQTKKGENQTKTHVLLKSCFCNLNRLFFAFFFMQLNYALINEQDKEETISF
jgi:hypothetical protein